MRNPINYLAVLLLMTTVQPSWSHDRQLVDPPAIYDPLIVSNSQKDYLEIPERDPRHLQSNRTFEKAMQLKYSGDDELALALVNRYIEQFQNESKTIKNEDKKEHDYYLAEGYKQRCTFYLNHVLLEKAIADCSELIKLEPRTILNYENRAKAYRLLGKNQLAESDEQHVRLTSKTSAKKAEEIQQSATPKTSAK